MTIEVGPRQLTPVEVRFNLSPIEIAPESARGPTGVTGPQGSMIYSGFTEPPSPSLGVNGDWYFANSQGLYTLRIYRKTSGVWTFFAQPQGVNYRGNYLSYLDYVVGDMVTYQGSTFVANIDPPMGTIPTNTLYWGVFAAAGTISPSTFSSMKVGTSQVNAGAQAGELWADSSAGFVVKLGQ